MTMMMMMMMSRFSNVGMAAEWLDGFNFTLDVRPYGYVGIESETPDAKM
jgi:hypothetical protein